MITRANNREVIEEELKKAPLPNAHFCYFDLSYWLRFYKRGNRGIHVYYYLWQIGIYFLARRLHYKIHFDLVHHVTFNAFRVPGLLFYLPTRFIWGPVGGGHQAPPNFERVFGFKMWFEDFRCIFNQLAKISWSVNKALKSAETILVADRSTLNFLPERYTNKYKLMLETGIALDSSDSKTNYQLENSVFHILWVGALIPRKGLPILLRSLNLLKHRLEFRVSIVGDGPEMKRCKRMAKKLSIGEKVIFFGKIPQLDVHEYYSKADVFVFTSLRDTSGNVVLEAMSSGLPIICLDHHGVADVVNKECGIKIKPLTYNQVVPDLANALYKLSRDQNLREKFGTGARKRVIEIYDWDKKGEEMNKIYEQVMGY